ncbi:MAG: hypothetical protein K6E51_12255 [Treponema sp.]|nr:hypothetical protein [Treponema sp.]
MTISCTDGRPYCDDAFVTVVFEYAVENEKPLSYVSFFIKLDSDVSRTASIRFEHVQTGYFWTIDTPEVAVNSLGNWVGYSCIFPRDGEKIQQGVYRYTYTNKAGDTCNGEVTLEYPDLLYTVAPSEVSAVLGKKSDKRIAIYAENAHLLYYDTYKKEWKTPDDIWAAFTSAVFFQQCYESKYTSETTIICKMPIQLKKI